jgi:hypothetical protein
MVRWGFSPDSFRLAEEERKEGKKGVVKKEKRGA